MPLAAQAPRGLRAVPPKRTSLENAAALPSGLDYLAARRLARRELRDRLLEPVQRPVDEAEAFELSHRVLKIFAARAAAAQPLENELRRPLERQPAGIAGMRAADGE